jgi:hypothetical protein
MNRRSKWIAVAGLIASVALVGAAVAAPKSATLTIRHQMKGCHSWAFPGGAWSATQSITLARGAKLTVIDNDVMPHKLVQLSGPQAKLTTPAMNHMGAQATVVFNKAGNYVFGTKAGEDYTSGIKTIGEDNVLRLVVTVK